MPLSENPPPSFPPESEISEKFKQVLAWIQICRMTDAEKQDMAAAFQNIGDGDPVEFYDFVTKKMIGEEDKNIAWTWISMSLGKNCPKERIDELRERIEASIEKASEPEIHS